MAVKKMKIVYISSPSIKNQVSYVFETKSRLTTLTVKRLQVIEVKHDQTTVGTAKNQM